MSAIWADTAIGQTIYSRPGPDGTIVFSNAPTEAGFNAHELKGVSRPTPAPARSGDDSPLVAAARAGNAPVVAQLVEGGADVNQKGMFNQTALYHAADQARAETVKMLIVRGARVDVAASNGATPLHAVAGVPSDREEGVEVIAVLLANGADPNAQKQDGRTPLHIAAGWGKTKAMRALLAGHANVNAADSSGKTPLHIAKNAATVNVLIEYGARTNIGDQRGDTPLHDAAFLGHVDVVKALLDHGADVSATNKFGGTPLGMVPPGKSAKVIELLVQHGAR